MKSKLRGRSAAFLAAVAVVACAKPQKYVPGEDAAAVVGTDARPDAGSPDLIALGTDAPVMTDGVAMTPVGGDAAIEAVAVTDVAPLPPDSPLTGPSCGTAPGQSCCENDTMPCTNNCGNAGTRTCRGGIYGVCSQANTCCGERSCSNNCGEMGSRPCNGTTLGSCSVADRACCPGQTRACSNSCGMTGTIPCRNGQFNAADCSAKDSSCQGGTGQTCRSATPKCDEGLFCCPDPGVCGAEVNKCLRRRVTGGKCNYSPDDSNCADSHYCDGDSDSCQLRRDIGEPCFDTPGSPKCKTGLRCEPVAGVCE